jgi:hypothetical protein
LSRSASFEFRGRKLWIYDTALAAWLVAFIDHVATLDAARARPLADLVHQFRVHAVALGDFHLEPERFLAADALDGFVAAAARASQLVRARGIDWSRFYTRPVMDDSPPGGDRGPSGRPTPEDVASIGDAIVDIARGTVPHAPPGTWWFLGTLGGRATIRMRPEAGPG